MKKVIFLFSALIFSIALIAQENPLVYANSDLIKLLPREGNGYLAWHDNNPNVKYWLVEVDEQTFDNGVFIGEKTVWKKEVWKSNYVKIPDENWRNESLDYAYYINLIGFDSSDDEVIRTRFGVDKPVGNPFEKGPYPPINIERGCYWICVGPNWAFRIQQWGDNGNAYYRLEDASFFEGETVISFPEYMTIGDHADMKSTLPSNDANRIALQEWYGITAFDWGPRSEFSPNSPFFRIPNDDSYRDINGNPFNEEEVIKVEKKRGWWKDPWVDGSLQLLKTDWLVDPQGFCVFDTQGMVDIMNDPSISNLPFLVEDGDIDQMLMCADIEADPLPGIDPGLCEMPYFGVDYDNDGDEDVFDIIFYYTSDCPDGPGDPPFPEPDVLSGLSFMIIDNISDPMSPYIEISGDDMFDESGVFTPPSFTVEKGLNKITIIEKGGKTNYLVFESLETFESDYVLSNFLSVNIFPVPLVEDDFEMNIQSGATMDFTYELFDFNGNLLHKINYSVKQGHNEDHKVRSDKPIPRGLLLNRFTFKDGSSLSITTTKN